MPGAEAELWVAAGALWRNCTAAYSWGAVERVAALAALRERAEAQGVPVMVRVNMATLRA